MSLPLFPCTIVGSYPQPEWLIDRKKLAGSFPPRTRAKELWRVEEEYLIQAQRDATLLAIRDMENAGLDIITDGEICRESYSNHFATSLNGIEIDPPGEALDRSGEPVFVPRVVGEISRRHSATLSDLKFLKENTDRKVKITVPGPFTMAQQAQNEFYKTPRETALAYAKVVREEVEDLFAAGADVVQLDEPYMQARPDAAREFGIEALDVALQGIAGKTCVHICFGYAALIHERPEGYSFLPEFADSCCNQLSIETAQSNLDCSVLKSLQDKEILLGVIDLSSSEVESPEIIKQRVYKALEFIDANKIILAPDCGMKYLPRESAFKKLSNMVLAAEQLRSEYA
jgi:5-methyltetrahydropteroyltriglutamate--homocysteine methyltransferase